MIYVTVGTMFMDFPRLIHAMDDVAKESEEEVIIQTGMDSEKPNFATHFDFKSREEVQAIQARARMIVCHAGIGSVKDALAAQRPFVVVPRLKRWNEHMNDHQLELARAVESRGWGRMVLDIAELRDRILKQDRRALARAITLVESARADHRAQAADLLASRRGAGWR